jgi:glycosyltransferase involved in cell wall biosynthesis
MTEAANAQPATDRTTQGSSPARRPHTAHATGPRTTPPDSPVPERGDLPRGIRFVSLGPPHGYGEAARRLMVALDRCGIPVTWTWLVPGTAWGLPVVPYEGDEVGDPLLRLLLNRTIDHDTVILYCMPEWYERWIEHEPGKTIVGATMWETDRIRDEWPAHLNRVDSLCVPCTWNREVFAACGVTVPIHVVPILPEVEDPTAPSPDADILARYGVRPDDFVFYTIGTWASRKGNAETVTAFLEAFTGRDPVVLVVKTNPYDLSQPTIFNRTLTTQRRVKRMKRWRRRPARVVVIDEDLPWADIRALHARGDCYVSLTRGEGWGLGAFDAAWAGHPVMVTGYSGLLDFLPPTLAYLLDYRLVPAVGRGFEAPIFRPDQRWAEPDVGRAAYWMRHVFQHQEEARQRGAGLRAHVQEHFDEEATMKKTLHALGVPWPER